MRGDARRQLARTSDELDVIGEHQGMNTDRQSLERVRGDIAHIDFEIRHVQQVSESVARPLAGER
jgi:hypothetical protein